jgi:predicted transcriptional regulator
MATTAVRVSEELLEDVKRLAALRGETPGGLLAEAWSEFIARHREEIAADVEEVAQMLRQGDRDGLIGFTRRTVRARAAAAAERANSH